MQVIASASLPEAALVKLSNMADLLLFNTLNITYPAISNHPDVFMCQTENGLVFAKNLPESFKNTLQSKLKNTQSGQKEVGKSYPESAHYNAVITEKYLIHNLKYTDEVLLDICHDKIKINVNQAYTRCNLLALANDWFITSDHGIETTLLKHHLHVLYVDPHEIKLPGFEHGFFGGTCGVFNQTAYFIGDVNYTKQGKEVVHLLNSLGYQALSLCEGPLYDGGSLFFIE